MSDQQLKAILLPGGVLPAELAYPAVIDALGPRADARFKELELYAGDEPPAGYSLETEVDGILRFADAAGFDRFHVAGYSASGAACLVLAATHPDRLLSVTVSEPSWAGDEGRSAGEKQMWAEFGRVLNLPEDEMMPAFIRMQLEPGVEPPPSQPGPPPPWMAKRPAGLRAFERAVERAQLDREKLRTFQRPVLFVLGAKSNQSYYGSVARRLADTFPDFTLDVYEGRHHFDPPHRAEPQRFAQALLAHWERAVAPAS